MDEISVNVHDPYLPSTNSVPANGGDVFES